MSTNNYPNPSMAKPHRCAFLVDDILDAMHPWNKENIKVAYAALRACMKDPEMNADGKIRPRYVTTKENYEELFDSEKAKTHREEVKVREKEEREEMKRKRQEAKNSEH